MPSRIVQLLVIVSLALTGGGGVVAVDGARADRVKDLVTIEGVRSNSLVGYGLVTGLAGTGDDASSPLVKQSLAKALKALGVTVNPTDLKAKNVAAVLVTAELPPFARKGQKLDVTITSIGGAKSLAGGVLIQAPLKGGDDRVWALAQGSVAVGGFLVEAGAGTERKNHITAARIPGGATVEGNLKTPMPQGQVVLLLDRPDFTTSSRIATAINDKLGAGAALARDAGSVVVPVSKQWRDDVPGLVAVIESAEATPDQLARVVVDERTGTVVIGGAVRLSPAAIAYGGLTISIREGADVSQPGPLSGGKTKVTPRSDVSVEEATGELHVIPAAASVTDVADALNALGTKPRDLIAIFQALVRAGALHAELEVM